MNEPERRLAGLLAADIVGYSRLLGQNETTTLTRVRALRRDVIEPQAAAHTGRLFKTTGDGFLLVFPSAVQALRCALAIQATQRADPDALQLRIGVHQGEVIPEGDDLVGDGVVIAARLEPLADPGGIVLSARVREDATGKITLTLEDLGTPTLKNIAHPIQIYRVRLTPPDRPALALPDKPSLVVLPFQNMSADPEQDYFADGMVEDITTALSRIGGLFVIARNSAFTYKGKPIDVKQVGRDLGVRYVLEGSVRKAANRVRITCQLIDTASAAHIWADRFDGTLEDVFDLQDQVTATVAGTIEPQLRRAEIRRAAHKPTESLQAYDMVLRASPHLYPFSFEGSQEAIRLLRRATEIDPDYALASALLAFFYDLPGQQGWTNSPTIPPGEVERLVGIAAKHGSDDPEVLAWCAFLTAHAGAGLEAAIQLVQRALAINPNSAFALQMSGQLHAYTGDTATALTHLNHALRLDPTSVAVGRHYAFAIAYFVAGQHDAVIAVTTKALAENANSASVLRMRAASLGLLGRIEEARATIQQLTELYGAWTLSRVKHRIEVAQNNIYRKPGVTDSIYHGLRLAGMPE